MPILVTRGFQKRQYKDLMAQMFRLRARSFQGRRGWPVVVVDGLEKDRFDHADTLYVLSLNAKGQLRASLRLLPTEGPHMLADIFPQTMGDSPIVRDPLIWESSRFCVDTKLVTARTASHVNEGTAEITLALFETAIRYHLTHIITVYDRPIRTILAGAGCRFRRLGRSSYYDGWQTAAALAEVTAQSTAAIRAKSCINHNQYLD